LKRVNNGASTVVLPFSLLCCLVVLRLCWISDGVNNSVPNGSRAANQLVHTEDVSLVLPMYHLLTAYALPIHCVSTASSLPVFTITSSQYRVRTPGCQFPSQCLFAMKHSSFSRGNNKLGHDSDFLSDRHCLENWVGPRAIF
jgi:hypothetical protein